MNHNQTHEAGADVLASLVSGGEMKLTDAEALANIRELVEEYDRKAIASIPTYTLVIALGDE